MNPAEKGQSPSVLESVPQPREQGLGVALIEVAPADAVVVGVEVVQGETVIGQQGLGIAVAEVAVVVGVVKH